MKIQKIKPGGGGAEVGRCGGWKIIGVEMVVMVIDGWDVTKTIGGEVNGFTDSLIN